MNDYDTKVSLPMKDTINIIHDCCTKSKKSEGGSVSDKIDKVVTNTWFAAVMFLVYYISVTTVGSWATDWANDACFAMAGIYSESVHLLTTMQLMNMLHTMLKSRAS